jgi:hypothetical protein
MTFQQLANQLRKALGILNRMDELRNKLYDTAYEAIGKDVSPQDLAPDEYACCESMSKILQKAFPELNIGTILSTRDLYWYFINSASFQAVSDPLYGDIVLSVTGAGNGRISNGHVGVYGKNASYDGSNWIMSNDSRTGEWTPNFTLKNWINYYEKRGGMQTHFFRRV